MIFDPYADALDSHVFVAPSNQIRAVHAEKYRPRYCADDACPHTCDWREPLGGEWNRHAVKPLLVRTTIREMLARVYATEAHFASYALTREGATFERQPRIRKDSLPWLRSMGFEVYMHCFMADWDTPGHLPWTLEELARLEALWASARGPLATCGLYLSPKGARLIQPVDGPMVAEEGEARQRTWLDQLVAAGVDPGVRAVHDWTRLMRVPNHRRDSGTAVRAPRVDVSRMIKVPPPPASDRRVLPRRSVTPRATPGGAAVALLHSDNLPAGWETAADAIGAALRDHVRAGEYRQCYLALSGALAERGCPLDGLGAVVARAHAVDRSYPEWEALVGDRVEIARSTAGHYLNRQPVLGYAALRARWPRVADALDATTVSAAEARVRRQLAEPAPAQIPVARAIEVIGEEIARAHGVVAIAAPPGTGKTHAVVERARRLPVIQGRARPGGRLVVSAPRHDLAEQTASKIPGALHLFSPPSLVRNGAPVCAYADAAKALAAGRQSVRRELCEGRGRNPCDLAEGCAARDGIEGDPNSALVVGVHGLVRELRTYAGPSGTLIVDEPGEVVFTERVTLDDLETAARYLDAFELRYATAIAPALAALMAWVREAGVVEGPLVSVHDAVRLEATGVPRELLEAAGIDPDPATVGDGVLVAAAGAIPDSARSHAPPLLWRSVALARSNRARAEELGKASRFLDLLWRGVTAPVLVSAHIDERGGERAATLVSLNPDLLHALEHEGGVVILDANAALHMPAVKLVLGELAHTKGTPTKLVELAVDDGAPILRTVLACGSANRSAWMPRGVPDWDAGILPALRAAVAWMARLPWCRTVGFIAPLAIEAAVAHTLRPDDPKPRKLWPHSKRALDAARAALAPVLAGFDGAVLTGHYGALEGLDFMAGCDATVTFMDPRPNLGDELLRGEFLGLDAEGRVDELAAAELEQAHGRLRTIHRTKPGRQLHVGVVVPHGWAGRPVDVESLLIGRPKGAAAMSAEEFTAAREASGVSQAAFARSVRVSVGAVKHYEKGRAPVPEDVARAVRSLAAVGSETPYRRGSNGGS